ncbi:hypothetical protein NUH86_01670 [Sphingobium sp. JS3065]|uniref:hypothetical protein n=1 Tax=Sphingobium sp. JS3065 TaxID=2970925 RepID=UPI002263D36F|nr:hypothetical protein [Sphingobium sp. JS3065]UZW55539.1 hypothetical protein NUH86_01670 [Sphingobium sp. JS3065]
MIGETNGPWVTRWGADPDSWNIHDPEDDEDSDGSNMPGRTMVREAVAFWAAAQPVQPTAEVVASVFNLPLHLAEDAMGEESIADVPDAIQVLTGLRHADYTVGEVAAVLLMPPGDVVAAVDRHPWMFLTGDRADIAAMLIEHDGE